MTMREKIVAAINRYGIGEFYPSNLNPGGVAKVIAWKIIDRHTGSMNVTGGHVSRERAFEELYNLQVDAVLNALAEPTDEMRNYVREFQNDHEISNKEIMQIWKPMIRAAKEGK